MRGHRRNMIWCDGCEQECAFIANARWRGLWIRSHSSEGPFLMVTPPLETISDAPDFVKRVCGDEGVLKLTSRFLSTGSLEVPRHAAADPPKQASQLRGFEASELHS